MNTGWTAPLRARVDERMSRSWATNSGAWRSYALLTALTLIEGVLLMTGPAARTSAASYRTIYQVGGPLWFGLVLALVGLALAVTPLWSHVAVRVTLMVGAVVHLLLGFSFIASIIADARAGLLGPPLYFAVGAWMLSQRELYRATT